MKSLQVFFSLSLLFPFAYASTGTHNIDADVFHTSILDITHCPVACHLTGPDPSNWTHTHDLEDLSTCPRPLLFDFNIDNEPGGFAVFRACTSEPSGSVSGETRLSQSPVPWAADVGQNGLAADEQSVLSLPTATKYSSRAMSMVAGPPGAFVGGTREEAAASAGLIASYLSVSRTWDSQVLFVKTGSALVGLYGGSEIKRDSLIKVVDEFSARVKQGVQVLQVCDTSIGDATVGLFAVPSVKQISNVQAAVQQWAKGECVAIQGEQEQNDMELSVAAEAEASMANATLALNEHWEAFEGGKRPTKLESPKPQPDGTCAVYQIKPNDICAAIAKKHKITVDDINKFNKASWGWAGCRRLQPGQKICLSKGNTPMPAPVKGVVCGPQKPGTNKSLLPHHFDGFDLAKLNPCPLNACCSGWGYCGTTAEFCTKAPADTGAPGSVQKGKNGCISHCGTDIVGNKKPPSHFRRVVYFEAFNVDRLCLTMDAQEVPTYKTIPFPFPHMETTDITHVHFAFAGITEDFQVHLDESVQAQFNRFSEMIAPWKKVISFGGWAESTGADTFQRYKDAVKPGNRDKFANTVVAFVQAHHLDGVDFDWEYPGAPDIPGVPYGGKQEAQDYLEFLKIVNSRLGDKSLSIALPASFWYLKAFPVHQMAEYLDYFIYMTYDLHGQWDYGNEFANPGYKAGNCLRSHVNKTETINALSMITKAGVPASQIVVGVSSYARSFGMADPSCTGPMCKFTGGFRKSTAEPGICTNTAGYISNAELEQIMASANQNIPGYKVKKWHDDRSDSDIMVYGSHGKVTTWAAYMDKETKQKRMSWIKGLNFGGTTDWAIDLASWNEGPPPGHGGRNSSDDAVFQDLPEMECDSAYWPATLEELQAHPEQVPAACRSEATLNILLSQVDDAVAAYEEASEGYAEKFQYYVQWVKEGINDSLEKFMFTSGRKYMDCSWELPGDSGSGLCTEMDPTFPDTHSGILSIEYTMRDSDGFYKALLAEYGIGRSWIDWQDEYSEIFPCSCPDGTTNCPLCQPPSGYFFKNWPRKTDDDDRIHVENPKKVVDAAIPNTNDLVYMMLDAYMQMRLGAMDAEDVDVATAFSMPVFMLQDASKQIARIKEIGSEVEEAEKKELIMTILTIVFAVIPFAGEAAAALGGAAVIARAALIIGEAGNTALSIVEIVDDPTSAPFAILGMIGSVSAIRAAGGARAAFSKAAGARRALGVDQMKIFGSQFRRKDGLVQDILKSCGM